MVRARKTKVIDLKPAGADRYFLEWLLFLLVFMLSFRAAWILHEEYLHDFFWKAYDGLGYYQWLPTTFFDQSFNWMFWCHKIAEGKAISLFTLGVALLQLPFFLLGHWMAWVFNYPMTGFEPPYAVAMMAGAATYTGFGAVLAYKIARRYATTPAALLAVLLIYSGSNLFFYATQSPLMSHVYSFFLVALFCWCALRVIDGPQPWQVMVFLFSGAMLVLVRQSNVFVFIFPVWMAGSSTAGIRGAGRNLLVQRGPLVLGLVLGLVPWVLQSIYWHHITGHWYANGYAYKEEYFDFGKMVPGMVLFSPRNGWFSYSPLFLLVVAVLLVRAWRNTRPARPVLLILALTILLYSAWWCWWLGGGYGYRALIDLYALLTIPLAWFFRSVMRRSLTTQVTVALMVCLIVHLNFGMMEHFRFDVFSDDGNWPEVLKVVGQIAAGK